MHTGQLRWDYDAGKVDLHSYPNTRGEILSLPAIWHDRAVFRTGHGLTAVRLTDGALLWNIPFDSGGPDLLILSGAPISDGRSLYFNADAGAACAIDPHDGHMIWATQTPGLSVTGAGNVRQIHVTASTCAPFLYQGRLLVADGLGDQYALRPEDGSILWQIHHGYTYSFASADGGLYAATDQGFFQLDPDSGRTLRSHAVLGGILRCGFSSGWAVLTHAILPNVPGGWELFDISHWKTIWHDPNFAAYYGLSVWRDSVYLAGYDTNVKVSHVEIRAYHVSATKKGVATRSSTASHTQSPKRHSFPHF